MRVLFVSRKWPPAVGGMETYAFELSHELARLTDLKVISLAGHADGRVPTPAALFAFGIKTAIRILRVERNHDVIHGADMAVWPLALLAKIGSASGRIVLSAHGTDVSFGDRPGIGPALYRGYMKLAQWLLPTAHIVANSRATADRVKAIGFQTVHVIPLGCHVAAAPVLDRPEQTILFVGRVVPRKGLQWFIDIVLPKLPHDLRLSIASPPPTEGAPAHSDRVQWVGLVRGAALARLMANVLCVVMPNIPVGPGHFEGFGLVALETAAAGGVLLASRMDGFLDSVIDGETGFLVEPMSSAAWVEAILTIRAWSTGQRATFIERARASVARSFSWRRVATDTLAVYESSTQELRATDRSLL